METFFKKVADLQFDKLTTLRLIEKTDDLCEIFREDVEVSFNLLYKLANENKLNSKIELLLGSMFDELICTKEEYADRYKNLLSSANVVVDKVEETVKSKPTETPKENSLPRRYGKEKIEQDIANQGGVATPIQRTMLKVNSLKNIYVNLQARGVKAMVGGQEIFTDEECRKIQSVITTVERQLEEILKKK